MKDTFRAINLENKIKIYLCVSVGTFKYSTNMNEILKVVIKLKKLVENIQRTWTKNHIEEWF